VDELDDVMGPPFDEDIDMTIPDYFGGVADASGGACHIVASSAIRYISVFHHCHCSIRQGSVCLFRVLGR
jgi:hypothetical protein